MKRKLLSVLLVLAMVLAILPVGAMAAENDPITKDGFTFGRAFVHGGLMVTGYEDKDATELTIPSEVDGQPVTELGGGCFMGFASLKSVTIPESVVHLWPNVFKDCTALTDVQFQGESVIVEGGDFDNCTSLEEITLPKQSMVANYMFDGCTNLKKVVISEGTRDWHQSVPELPQSEDPGDPGLGGSHLSAGQRRLQGPDRCGPGEDLCREVRPEDGL